MPAVATGIAADAIGRSTTPAGAALAPSGVEAAVGRGLVVHPKTFPPRPERSGSTARLFKSQIRQTVAAEAPRAIPCLTLCFLGHEPCRRAFLSRWANSIMS